MITAEHMLWFFGVLLFVVLILEVIGGDR